jgi:endonuclease-3
VSRVGPAEFRKAFAVLKRRYPVGNWTRNRHPFDVLVSIMVSQNSTDLVTARVMAELRRRGAVTPNRILRMRSASLVRVLQPAGLARQKVPRIRAVAREVKRRYGSDLRKLLDMDTETARRALQELPGVGPKTADVWLSAVGGRDTMPIDTHIHRIARRWRLSPTTRYEDVTAALKALIPPRERGVGHLRLIEFGRDICHARGPECDRCPVYELCDAEDRR